MKSCGIIHSAEHQLSRLTVLVIHLLHTVPKIKPCSACIYRREEETARFVEYVAPAVVNKTQTTHFAMLRPDWAIIGGPQGGKISRVPVSRGAEYLQTV